MNEWAICLPAAAAAAKSLQSCRTLCDPVDGSPPGSPVPGVLQARTLEWVYVLLVLYENAHSLYFKQQIWPQWSPHTFPLGSYLGWNCRVGFEVCLVLLCYQLIWWVCRRISLWVSFVLLWGPVVVITTWHAHRPFGKPLGGRAYISLFFQLGCLSFLIPLWDVFMYIGCKSSVYIYIANTLSCFVTHLLT